MLITEYLHSIENTEQEQEFLQQLAELKQYFVGAANVPFAGEKIRALIALGDSDSIGEFKQTEFFARLEGWNISFHPGGGFSIYPGKDEMLKAAVFIGCIIAAVIILKRIFRRRR